MSDVSEEEKSTHPTTATRTVFPSIRPSDFQEEPQNIHRRHNKESVGDITENSLNDSIRCQARIESSLGGDTSRDSQTPDILHRGAVGDTAATPRSQTENLNSQDTGILTSPATSTPGSTPATHKNGELKNSELQSSEESVIESSIIDEDRRQKLVEDEDFITIKMADHTLADKSVGEEESHDVEDTSWETTIDNTDCREEGPISCVANRTRSHTEDLRKNNLSEFLEGMQQHHYGGEFRGNRYR